MAEKKWLLGLSLEGQDEFSENLPWKYGKRKLLNCVEQGS